MPLNEDGRTTLPTVWVPSPMGICLSATAAPDPEDEPPGDLEGSCGFLVPGATVVAANSEVLVLPGLLSKHNHILGCDRFYP